jgi:hypothetical protein
VNRWPFAFRAWIKAAFRLRIHEFDPDYMRRYKQAFRAGYRAANREADRLRNVLNKARAWSEMGGGCDNPDVPLTCQQTPGEPLCTWCEFDVALRAYDESRPS